ncbi:hypothetical protein EI94DRAFT_823123 [Lactarius quietus]|nr:hypothetical protein EI94DRAFT_823123 [Lactarius quietus]
MGSTDFGMARAVRTMPAILHVSVFLFFIGLVEFLFPIYTTVAYTLGCIVVFALAYASLTVLPSIYLNCPYATPLSGLAWRIYQFSAMVFPWTILKIEGLVRKPSLKFWSLTYKLLHRGTRDPTDPSSIPSSRHEQTHGHEGPKPWRERLENQVKMRQQRFSQGLRERVELSAYGADSTVVTSALEWTLTALDQDREIEDFAARVPRFFDSRAFPEATLAILPLMSHQPNTVPIFGPRLYDLLRTCLPDALILDENSRKKRLRVCMKLLLPSYFPGTLADPATIHNVKTEEDPEPSSSHARTWIQGN